MLSFDLSFLLPSLGSAWKEVVLLCASLPSMTGEKLSRVREGATFDFIPRIEIMNSFKSINYVYHPEFESRKCLYGSELLPSGVAPLAECCLKPVHLHSSLFFS